VKKKLMIVAPVLVVLLAVGAVYKVVLAPKPAPAPKPKIDGALVALEKEFLVNLAGGRYGKVSVALLIDAAHAPAAGGHGGGDAPALHQDAAVRSIITDHLTGLDADHLIERKPRQKLLKQLAHELHEHTDEHVKRVMFTDIAVQ
jgi:flagellar FliL protein